MGTSVANGLLGAVIVVIAIYVAYGIATKKFLVKLPNGLPGVGDWKGGTKFPVLAIGIVAFLWSIYGVPGVRPAGMGNWGKEYWLQILIVWITLGVLLALSEMPKMFQWVLAGTALGLLIVLPIWSAASSPSKDSGVCSRSDIPRVCEARSSWPKLVLQEGWVSPHLSVPPHMRPVLVGEEFRVHCVYRNGHEVSFGKGEEPCPEGDMPFVYAENIAKGENTIIYAFAPPK